MKTPAIHRYAEKYVETEEIYTGGGMSSYLSYSSLCWQDIRRDSIFSLIIGII